MTLSELLEELKAADPDTWDVVVRGIPLKPFCQYFTFDRCGQRAHQYPDVYLPFSQMERDVALAWLQGCIQRACEKRECWEVSVWWKDNKWVALIRLPGGYTNINQMFAEESDSPAEALLAAYIAAVKEEKRSTALAEE